MVSEFKAFCLKEGQKLLAPLLGDRRILFRIAHDEIDIMLRDINRVEIRIGMLFAKRITPGFLQGENGLLFRENS